MDWHGWSIQQHRLFSSSTTSLRRDSSNSSRNEVQEDPSSSIQQQQQQQRIFPPKTLSEARSMAELLIQRKNNLTDSDLQTARTIFKFILDEDHPPPDADTIQVAIQLLERIVLEHSRTKTNQSSSSSKTSRNATSTPSPRSDHQRLILKPWYCHPDFYNPLLQRWKEFAMHSNPNIRDRVIAPATLGDKLYQLSQLTRHEFGYDLHTVAMVMEAILFRTPVQKRPTIAERMVELLQQEAHDLKRSDLEPDLTIYTQVVQAWLDVIDLFPDRATQSLQSWLTRIRNEGIRMEEDERAMKLVLKIASIIGFQPTRFPLLQELLKNYLVPELSTMQDKCKQLEHTITQLQKQLANHTAMAEKLHQHVQSLTDDAKEVDETLQFKSDRIQDLETQINELHQRADELQNENNSYRTQLKKLKPKPEYIEPKTKPKTTPTAPPEKEEEVEDSTSADTSTVPPTHPRPRGRAPKGTNGWDPHRGAWIKRIEDESTVYF
jgi:uncharacterized protein YoxC